jgi:hypothetical protein
MQALRQHLFHCCEEVLMRSMAKTEKWRPNLSMWDAKYFGE